METKTTLLRARHRSAGLGCALNEVDYRMKQTPRRERYPPSYGWQEDLYLMSSSFGHAQPLNLRMCAG